MGTKYHMTASSALRIAATICATGYPTHYEDDVLGALRDEGFAEPDRRVGDLITELARADKSHTAQSALKLIAQACADEARRDREVLRDLRRGMRGLGLVFEGDVKREALKE
jgi:hypothetical protein